MQKLKKIGKRLLSVAVCASMLTVYTPTANTAKAADTVSNPRVSEEDNAVWDCIYFGNYYQKNSSKKEPIKWRVLSVEGDQALILADKVLDCQPYNKTKGNVTWEDCTLRKWLNNDFLNAAFTKEEKEAVKTTTVVDNPAPQFGINQESRTEDKLFLLSREDVYNEAYGFNSSLWADSSKTRRVNLTAYTKEQLGKAHYLLNRGYLWCLRAPGCVLDTQETLASCADINSGKVAFCNLTGLWGVRPALNINLSSSCWSKAGEVDTEDFDLSENQYSSDNSNGNNFANEKKDIKPNIKYPSQSQIKKFVKKHKFNVSGKVKMSKKASLKAPYAMGAVSKASLNDGLNALNTMRYIAGLPANVTLDSDYTKMCQAAALVNAVNNELSHNPKKPKKMKDSLYELGKKGAGSSNIACASWETSLSFSVVHQWMEDGDDSNIDRVGHRRWVLNPSMKKTGFGYADGYSAMYAFDFSNSDNDYCGVAWPAKNMPVSYFGNDYPWSVSIGKPIEDISNVNVTLKKKSNGKTWKFSKKSSNGYFNINNDGYGQSGCIIFRPNKIKYKAGDTFEVTITGLEKKIAYQVKFFSL